jgi:hypothetical protein
MTSSIIAKDVTSITVRIPVEFRHRQAGKSIVPSSGAAAWAPAAPRIDNTLIRAVVRGHRWRTMLESGNYATIRELAIAEKANESYVCRLLRLTLLAPELIEAIMNGTQDKQLQLSDLLGKLPLDWNLQKQHIAAQIRLER